MLRKEGGYAGWTDDQLLDMPYARFSQALSVASETRQEEYRDRMKIAAFVGWQNVAAWGGRKVGTFPEYLEKMGLVQPEPMTADARKAAIEKGYAVLERARAAFAPKAA